MAQVTDWLDDFSGGVNMFLPKNKLDKNTFPLAINTALIPAESGGVGIGKRPGFSLKGLLGGTAGTYASGLGLFAHNNAGTVTEHLIAVDNEGLVYNTGNPSTQITVPTGNTEFAAALIPGAANGVKFAQANNMLFGCTGSAGFKIFKDSGTLYVRAIGGRAPTSAPTGTIGEPSSGVMNGLYEFVCTFYNSKTGVESAVSPIYSPIALVNQNIDINVSGIGTPNLDYDKVNIYIRRGGATVFVRNASMQVATGDTSTVLNLGNDDIDNLFTQAPLENENGVFPANITDICWHLSRMFATDGVNLYYSKVGEPENWNALNFELVNPNDGQKIIALHSVNETVLLVLKERSCYLLVGDTSQSWEIRLLTQSIGCTAKKSVAEGEGVIGWWGHVGPVLWAKSGEPEVVDSKVVRELYRRDQIDVSDYNVKCCNIFDTRNKRFLFSFTPKSGSSYAAQKLTVLPFSLVNRVWESSGWDLDTIHSVAGGRGSNGEYNIFFSTTDKLVFELSDKFATDGAQNQTGVNLHYPITVANSNSVSFVASTPPYNTSKSYCKIINLDTLEVHRSTYTLSGSGTLTATLGTSFSTVPSAGSIITFDLPVMELDSKILDGDSPLDKKRYLKAYMRLISNGDVEMLYGIRVDATTTLARVWSVVLSKASREEGSGGTISGSAEQFSGRIAKVGEECQLRVVGYYPQSRWFISGFGIGSYTTYAR